MREHVGPDEGGAPVRQARHEAHEHGGCQGSGLEVLHELLEQPEDLLLQRGASSQAEEKAVL